MRYDALTAAYWQTANDRVEALRARIAAMDAVSAGRVIPEEGDLVIGEGRRIPAAVLFLDVSSFSSRPSETEAEQDLLLRGLNLFFAEMVRIAEDYGGVVEKNTGDGLMSYYEDGGGDPPECGSKRALASALSMMAIYDVLIARHFIASNLEPFRFRIGIDHGTITVGKLGAPRRFNALVAIGTTANIACKLLALAEPGEILLGEAARRQLPVDWQLAWTELLQKDSGWIYRVNGLPYPAYRYTGRWNQVVD